VCPIEKAKIFALPASASVTHYIAECDILSRDSYRFSNTHRKPRILIGLDSILVHWPAKECQEVSGHMHLLSKVEEALFYLHKTIVRNNRFVRRRLSSILAPKRNDCFANNS
jgi:hypothetical protein